MEEDESYLPCLQLSGEERACGKRKENKRADPTQNALKFHAADTVGELPGTKSNRAENEHCGQNKGDALNRHLQRKRPARQVRRNELRKEGKKENEDFGVRHVHEPAPKPEFHSGELHSLAFGDRSAFRRLESSPGEVQEIGSSQDADPPHQGWLRRDEGGNSEDRQKRLAAKARAETGDDEKPGPSAVKRTLRQDEKIVGAGGGGKHETHREKGKPEGRFHDEKETLMGKMPKPKGSTNQCGVNCRAGDVARTAPKTRFVGRRNGKRRQESKQDRAASRLSWGKGNGTE